MTLGRSRIDSRVWLIALVGLAAFTRLAYVLIAGKTGLSWGDEFAYDRMAMSMLQNGAFDGQQLGVVRAPLYPLIMAVIYGLLGRSYINVTLLQALFGALGVVALVSIGRKLTDSLAVGMIAGLMFAIHPILVFTSNLLYSETLYLSLLLGTVYLLLMLPALRHRYAIAILSGILLGLSNLMKPNLLLFPACLVAWGWIAFGTWRKAAAVAALVVLGMLLVILPWSVRNVQTTGHFVLISANTGLNLFQGNNPQADGGALDVKYIDPLPNLDEVERDAVYWRRGADWIRENPAAFLRLVPAKLYKLFSPLETSNRGSLTLRSWWLLFFGLAAVGLYYALALAGLLISAKNWRRWLLPYLLIAYHVLMTIMFYGGTRYGLVIQPFLMLLAALAVVELLKYVYEKYPRFGAKAVPFESR